MTVLLDRVSMATVNELACKAHPGVWAEQKRGFVNAPFHWEWYELMLTQSRVAVVAPREHAKSEVFTVNGTAWRSRHQPGLWTYVFAQTGDQAGKIKARIDAALLETDPWMVENAKQINTTTSVYANYARVDAVGAGKAVRGAHPDVIIGDDVLEEGNCMTAFQRRRTERWWFGTIGGMSHPGTTRALGSEGHRVVIPPTKVFMVGTPFHAQDLLMGMEANPMYVYRRYAAEYDPARLVDGYAVDVA